MATVNKAFKVKNGLIVDGVATDVVIGSDTLPEVIQDTVGAMVSSNTENGIAVTYDDDNGKINFDVNDPTITLSGDVTGTATMTNLGNVTITTSIASDSVALGTDTTGDYVASVSAGTGISVSGTGEGASVTVTNSDPGSSQNIFKNIAVSGQSTIAADSNDDTLTVAAGTGVTITTNDTTDTITIANSGVTSVDSVTGDVTATNLLDAIKTVDGTGSGLDADTLDGNEASAFSLTGHTHTASNITDFDEAAQDAAASLFTTATHSGVTVEYTDANGTLAITNSGVTSVSGTANEIEVSAGTGAVTIGLPDNVTVGGTLTVTGDLTVNGTTTTLNTTELAVEDNIITLNANVTGTPSLDAGVEVERGDSTNAKLYWNETADKWYVDNGTGSGTEIALVGDATFNTFSSFTDGTNTAEPDTSSDTLTFAAGTGLSVAVNASTDTVTYSLDSAATASVGSVTMPNSKIEDGTVTSSGTSVTIDTFALATYKSAKYVVQMTNAGGDAHIVEVLVTAVGTSAYIVEYGELITNASLGDVTADSDGTDVTVSVVSTESGVVVKHTVSYIEA